MISNLLIAPGEDLSSAMRPGLWRRSVAHLARVVTLYQDGVRRRRVCRELLERPDFLLRDVGLTRTDLLRQLDRPLIEAKWHQ